MAGVTDFTISAWVKLNTANNTGIFRLWNGHFGLHGTLPEELVPNGYMRYEIVSGGTVQQINTTYAFPTECGRMSRSRSRARRERFTSTVRRLERIPGLTLKTANLGTTTLNYIGKSQWNDPYLNGSVDEFQIYGRALSASRLVPWQALWPPDRIDSHRGLLSGGLRVEPLSRAPPAII